MKLLILARASLLVLSSFNVVNAVADDLDTAESQASFGYGYGTKVSTSCPAVFKLFSFAHSFSSEL